MNKDYLFHPSNKNIDMQLLISFCNEVISLNSLLKQTYLGNKYNKTLINFIIKIMNNYTLQNEQLSVMKQFGDKRRAPHQYIWAENRAAALWRSAMDTIEVAAMEYGWLEK